MERQGVIAKSLLRGTPLSVPILMLTATHLLELLSRCWQRLRRRLRVVGRTGEGPFPGQHAAWPKTHPEFEKFWADSRAQALYLDPSRLALYREVLDVLPQRPCRVLDLGCGNGQFLRLVADRWQDEPTSLLVGIDYAESAIQSATRLVPEAAFRVAPARATGFPDATFDAVVAMEVFEHLRRPRAVLKEAWRLVAPGGRLLITIPDGVQDWWPGHTNFWSDEAFLRFLHPLPVRSVRRLGEGKTLLFEVVKPADTGGRVAHRHTALRRWLASWIHARLRRHGWDLVRYRARPTYPAELSRYASQIQHADLRIKPGSIVLDIGSGHYPFPHATILSDLHLGPTHHRTDDLVRDGRPLVVFDVHRLPFRDQSVDFIYCSHVLEHAEDPARACTELLRVGHEGYIETPTLGKDVLFGWAGAMHRWHVIAIGNRLVFFEYTSRQLEGMRSSAWRDLIYGDAVHPLQEAYYANEDVFNVMFRWRGRLDWVVYRLDGSVESSGRSPGLGSGLPGRKGQCPA